MNLEREAKKLAEAYLKFFLGRFRYRLFSLKDVKGTKWWSSFYKAASSFSKEKEWNAYEYAFFIFEINEKPFPFMFVYGKNWIAYKEHIQARTKGENTVATSLLNTFNEIKGWSRKNGYEGLAVEDFFSNPNNFVFLKRGKFSPYFLSVSRSFIKIYNSLTEEEKNDIITENDIVIKRRTVLDNKKISQKLIEVLGEEYIGFN